MKFGKSIGSQQEGHIDLHYVEYKLLKRRVKDVVARLEVHDLAEALTANTAFEEELAAEIGQVNTCFARHQRALLERTAALAEEFQGQEIGGRPAFAASAQASSAVASSASSAAEPPPPGEGPGGGEGPCAASGQRDSFRRLVTILGEVDQLRKYAVWNAVAVVKILKKRRKHTNFGLEDTAAERAGWLSRQSFFSGSDFAELHAAIESLGHMLVRLELAPVEGVALRPQQASEREPQKCPICLDTISDMVELSCNHRFCWKCFVLGPIAFQPGEYKMAECPICRQERPRVSSGKDQAEGALATENTGFPSSEGILTRFLHTYFPQEVGQPDGEEDWEAEEARREGEQSEREMRDVVGELVKALNWKTPGKQQDSKPATSSSAAPSKGDFFDTLPPQKTAHERQLLGAAQKLQWLQLASTGDPLALDGTAYCSLCSEPLLMEAVVTTPCKHYFHRVCIGRLDMPNCPICGKELPFSWFLPAEHPCADCGFRVVPAQDYRPVFAGGPSKRSCGYPLLRPPPVSLYAKGGLVMKSYLHCVPPTGSIGGDGHGDDEGTPRNTPHGDSPGEVSSASDSSSEDSNSEVEDAGEAEDGGVVGTNVKQRGRDRACVLSALGRMRRVDLAKADAALRALHSTPPPASSARHHGADAQPIPGTGPGSFSSGGGGAAVAPPPAPTLVAAGDATAASRPAAGSSESEQRNPTVLLIGNHL